MRIMWSKVLALLLACSLAIIILSCNSLAAPPTKTVVSPTSEEQNMVTVKYPSLRLSANGTTAFLDTVNHGFRIYTVPDLDLRFSADSYENVVDVMLSSSGATAGIRTTTNELVVVRLEQSHTYKLPHDWQSSRSLTISDAGDKMAILVLFETPSPATSAKDNGALEIWSLPPGDSPLASIKLPLFSYGLVTANGSFSNFAVSSGTSLGHQQFMAVYQFTKGTDDPEGKGQLSPLWTEQGPSVNRIAVALYNDWVWAVQADGLIGWSREAPAVQLPGTLRERLLFSPTGSHLLAYRAEKTVNVTSAEVLFRLFDLSSLKEIKRATHVIEQESNAHFALSSDLSLFELRATREAEIQIKELGW